jgi:hypothetical protein
MGWGWCSGTVLWGDLAISRGVDVSLRSWGALLDKRLPVGTGHGLLGPCAPPALPQRPRDWGHPPPFHDSQPTHSFLRPLKKLHSLVHCSGRVYAQYSSESGGHPNKTEKRPLQEELMLRGGDG